MLVASVSEILCGKADRQTNTQTPLITVSAWVTTVHLPEEALEDAE